MHATRQRHLAAWPSDDAYLRRTEANDTSVFAAVRLSHGLTVAPCAQRGTLQYRHAIDVRNELSARRQLCVRVSMYRGLNDQDRRFGALNDGDGRAAAAARNRAAPLRDGNQGRANRSAKALWSSTSIPQ
jgi:hypothetical protein